MKFIKKNKNTFIILGIVLIVLIITFIALFHFLFSGYKTSKYGNRLTGIENVQISDETIKRVQQELERSGYIPNMAGI